MSGQDGNAAPAPAWWEREIVALRGEVRDLRRNLAAAGRIFRTLIPHLRDHGRRIRALRRDLDQMGPPVAFSTVVLGAQMEEVLAELMARGRAQGAPGRDGNRPGRPGRGAPGPRRGRGRPRGRGRRN